MANNIHRVWFLFNLLLIGYSSTSICMEDHIQLSLEDPKLIQKYAQQNSLPHMILHTTQLLKKKTVDYKESQQWVLKCQKRLCQFLDGSQEDAKKAWQLFAKLKLEDSCKKYADQEQNYHMQCAYGSLRATLATAGEKLGLLNQSDAKNQAIEGRDYLKKGLKNIQNLSKNEKDKDNAMQELKKNGNFAYT